MVNEKTSVDEPIQFFASTRPPVGEGVPVDMFTKHVEDIYVEHDSHECKGHVYHRHVRFRLCLN